MKDWPIYIPSKGRPNSKIFGELPTSIIVVEPQDIDAYKETNKNKIIKLDKNNQGIRYVRQYILDLNRDQQNKWFWMIDDDLTATYLNNYPSKPKKIEIKKALAYAEASISGAKHLGQVALEYQQFSWASKKNFSSQSYCDCVVGINTLNTIGINYRPVDIKEDRDFTLQVLSAGYGTTRL